VLKLRRNIHERMLYKILDRSTFYRFADRLGFERMTEIFARTAAKLVKMEVIRGEKVSLDCSIIWARFKDCMFARRQCRRHRENLGRQREEDEEAQVLHELPQEMVGRPDSEPLDRVRSS
jgi:hypothetical protein